MGLGRSEVAFWRTFNAGDRLHGCLDLRFPGDPETRIGGPASLREMKPGIQVEEQ